MNFFKKHENKQFYLLIVGLIAAIFYSATFLLNRSISLDGGHWYWSATLRFFYTLSFLSFGFILFKGFSYYKEIIKEYINHFKFWTVAGSIGFGVFYTFICYAAEFSPAWVIATTWQITIIASLFVLSFFGQKIKKSIWFFTIVIFIGITLVNLSHIDFDNLEALFLGFLPILVAAFAFPIGNQLVYMEKIKRGKDKGEKNLLNNTFVKVFLLTLGSAPLWIILSFTPTSTPTLSQHIDVAMISFLSGIIASSIFLYARSKANTPAKLMAVDATQSGDVIFTLIAEMLFLGALFPNMIGVLGILITFLGLIILVKLGK